MLAGFRELGQNPRQQAVESSDGVSDQLIRPSATPASFLAQVRAAPASCEATEGWPGLRLLAGMACTHLAGRSLAAILIFFGCVRWNFDGLDGFAAVGMSESNPLPEADASANGAAANCRVRHGRRRKRADTWCQARRTSVGAVTPWKMLKTENLKTEKGESETL
jgi:hypothetical protein